MLDYLPSTIATKPLTELDHAVAAERGRWIRRRLLIYASIALALLTIGLFVGLFIEKKRESGFAMADSAVSVVLLVTAIVLACRTAPNYQRILRIAVALFLAISAMNLVSTRLTFEMLRDEMTASILTSLNRAAAAEYRIEEQRPRGDQAVSISNGANGAARTGVTTTQTSTPAFLSSRRTAEGIVFGSTWVTLFGTLLYNHLLASFFIPWTWRDTFRPAAVLLLIFSIGLAVDANVHAMSTWLWLPIMLASPMAFVPGSIVCWWRYSRFNKNFRLQFESKRYRALQTELDGARRIHDACLPAQLRDGPIRINYAYQPMRQIGGDLLFVHPAPGEPATSRLAVLLDVTGHGIAAALTVNRLVGELERIVSENPEVQAAAVLCALNRYTFLTLARHNVFPSGLAVRVDARVGLLTYANAGHPLPVLCRGDGAFETLDSTAMLLGVLPPADFECVDAAYAFEAGDRFTIYTDGAVDARNAVGLALGTQGVVDVICRLHKNRTPGDHAPRLVLEAVRQHRAGSQEDDVLVAEISVG